MITALDVGYCEDRSALAAAVVFADFDASQPSASYQVRITEVADYQPGSFFRRELPCLLSVLKVVREPVRTVIIDGYVWLGDRPGLGAHLWKELRERAVVIGVAKTPYDSGLAQEVLRGSSKTPLYVTAQGMDSRLAAKFIREMHGTHRIPTLLREVDRLSRHLSPKVVDT